MGIKNKYVWDSNKSQFKEKEVDNDKDFKYFREARIEKETKIIAKRYEQRSHENLIYFVIFIGVLFFSCIFYIYTNIQN